MNVFEENEPRPANAYEIGQDLALLSVDELMDLIALLRGEIVRLETEAAAKSSTKRAADALFRS